MRIKNARRIASRPPGKTVTETTAPLEPVSSQEISATFEKLHQIATNTNGLQGAINEHKQAIAKLESELNSNREIMAELEPKVASIFAIARAAAKVIVLLLIAGLTACNTLTIKGPNGTFATSTSILTSSKQRTHSLALTGIGSATESITDEDETSVAKSLGGAWALSSIGKAKETTAQLKDTNATNLATTQSNNAAAAAAAAAKADAQTKLLLANPQAVKAGATTLSAP